MPKVREPKEPKALKPMVKVEYNLNTLGGVCDYYGIEYREGVTRYIDVAKQLNVYYVDGMGLEELVAQAGKKK